MRREIKNPFVILAYMQYGRKQYMAIRYPYNSIYRDQIAKSISAAQKGSHGFQDVLAAESALEWLIAYLEAQLAKCLQTEETGVCDMTWKHDDCALLMSILYDLTKNDRYVPKYSWNSF